MPRNAAGVPIRPDEYNRNDGFSPGSPILTLVPGLDDARFARTGLVPITDMARAFDADQPAVVIDAATRRAPADLGGDRRQRDDRRRPQPLHPARPQLRGGPPLHRRPALPAGRRGARRSRPSRAFPAYRDKDPARARRVEPRRAHMDELFKTLKEAGIERNDLYLAWDFTVGSEQRICRADARDPRRRLRAARRHRPRRLEVEGSAPTFRVTAGRRTRRATPRIIARASSGALHRALLPEQPGCPPGSKFLYTDPTPTRRRDPRQHGGADFTCIVPRSAADGPRARRRSTGTACSAARARSAPATCATMAAEHDFVFCATDWSGMAQQDVPTTVGILGDLSNFATLADRVQQGMLNFLYLGRR